MKLYRAIVEKNHISEIIYELSLDYKQFEVIRETHYFYIIKVNGKEKRIGKKSKAQFAATTKEKALMDAWHRNRFYRSILSAKTKHANMVKDFIKKQIDLK